MVLELWRSPSLPNNGMHLGTDKTKEFKFVSRSHRILAVRCELPHNGIFRVIVNLELSQLRAPSLPSIIHVVYNWQKWLSSTLGTALINYHLICLQIIDNFHIEMISKLPNISLTSNFHCDKMHVILATSGNYGCSYYCSMVCQIIHIEGLKWWGKGSQSARG
jgi:hypothetical protein